MQLSGVRLSVRLSVRMYGCNRQRSSFDTTVTAHCDSIIVHYINTLLTYLLLMQQCRVYSQGTRLNADLFS